MFKGKIFCIGRNKTGTTSLEAALEQLGYRLGDQRQGELLLDDWGRRDFRRIVELASTADAFQDIPFSLPYTYQALDAAFENAKFILTVRDSSEQWYGSVVRFHSGVAGTSQAPKAEDLQRVSYVHLGWLLKNQRMVYGVADEQLYDREIYTRHYTMHMLTVTDYFRYRPGKLLVLNVAHDGAMRKLCEFLAVQYQGQQMPHLNRTR